MTLPPTTTMFSVLLSCAVIPNTLAVVRRIVRSAKHVVVFQLTSMQCHRLTLTILRYIYTRQGHRT